MRGFFVRKIIPASENLCRCKAPASTGVQPAQGVTDDEIEVQALLELGEVGRGRYYRVELQRPLFEGLKLEASEYCGRVNITRTEYGSAANNAIGGKL